jgi:hypothetical protein
MCNLTPESRIKNMPFPLEDFVQKRYSEKVLLDWGSQSNILEEIPYSFFFS